MLAEIAHLSSDGFKVIDGGGPTGLGRQDAMFKARLGPARDARILHDVEPKPGFRRDRLHQAYPRLLSRYFCRVLVLLSPRSRGPLTT